MISNPMISNPMISNPMISNPIISREMIVAQARQWIGTPYHHAGRSRHGVDCVGLAVMVARELGLDVRDQVDYNRSDNLGRMVSGLTQFCAPVPITGDAEPGDILIFRGGSILHHVGIASGEGSMIHVYTSAGRVVEQEIGGWWTLLFAVFRLRVADVPTCAVDNWTAKDTLLKEIR